MLIPIDPDDRPRAIAMIGATWAALAGLAWATLRAFGP